MKNYSKSLDYYNNVTNEEGIAFALNMIGFIHDTKDEYDEAIKKSKKVSDIEKVG